MPQPKPPSVNPLRALAVQTLASLEPARTRPAMLRHLTALRTMLTAAGVEVSGISEKPSESFKAAPQHIVVCWYDVVDDELRLLVPPIDAVDETTRRAIELLNGTVHATFDRLPIEDFDAINRMMAILGTGADDAKQLHARYIAPNARRYDEELTPPDVEQLSELWCTFRPYYIGGTSRDPEFDGWITATYAFGF